MFKYSRDLDAIRERLHLLEDRITALQVDNKHLAKNSEMLGQTITRIGTRLDAPTNTAPGIGIDRMPPPLTAEAIGEAVAKAIQAEGVKL